MAAVHPFVAGALKDNHDTSGCCDMAPAASYRRVCRYFDMRPAQIGELIGAAKLGKVVKKMINMVPRLQLDASIQPLTRGLLRVDLVLTPDFQWDQEVHGYVEPFLILVRSLSAPPWP